MSAYLVTDGSSLKELHDFPLTIRGYEQALLMASTLAQFPDLHPNGVWVEKRTDEHTVRQIVKITAA
jgi:hypothetical protein